MSIIQNLLGVLTTAVWVLPFILISQRNRKINLPVTRRAWQLLIPFAALLYCVPTMLLADNIAVGLVNLVNLLEGLLRSVPLIGGILGWLVGKLHLGYGVQLLANTALMTGWCVCKRMLLHPAEKLCRRLTHMYARMALPFYEQNEEDEHPYLRENCQQLRRFFGVFYVAFLVLGAADMALCLHWPENALYAFPIYPVFGIILISEICFFLGGKTRREMLEGGDDEEELEKPDFDEIYRGLEDTFGDRLLYGDRQQGIVADEKNSQEYLEEMGLAEDGLQRITSSYFLHRMQAGEAVEKDYVQAALGLLRGESTLFCNPFYRDLTPYLMLPIQHCLLNHRRVLVVSGRCSGDADVLDWLRGGLLDACSLENLWKCSFLKQNPDPRPEDLPDVGILSFNDLYNLELQQANQQFLAGTSLVILLEPSNLMGAGQVGLRSVCQQCERPGKQLTYCIIDRSCDGLVDALSHTVRQSLVEVSAAPVPRVNYFQMFWAAEGRGVADRILRHISHYMGFGCELGVFALKKKARKVYWYSGSRFALQDLRWAVGQYTRGLCGYIGCPAQQSELDARFTFVDGLWQARRHKDAFVVVEDEFNNLFEMARAFAARADGSGFVNVLSGSYMLRDYMCANAELFENDPKAIPTLCPDFARTPRNFVLRALMLMAAAPQEESQLRRELRLYGDQSRDVYRALCDLIRTHTGLPAEILQVFYREEEDPATTLMVSRKYFSVARSDFGRLYAEVLRPACFVVENEKSGQYFMGARMMGQVCQTLLPGQFFSYEGRHYEVQSITPEDGVIVRRAADHLTGRPVYRQLRTYVVERMEVQGNGRDLRGIRLNPARGDLRVETDGYFVMPAADNLAAAHRVALEGTVDPRTYRNKEFIYIQLPDTDSRVVFTLCALLNELFVTLYPNERGFLYALPCGVQPADDIQRAVVPAQTGGPEEPGILLVEDCYMDLGLVVSAERSFQRILEMAADYLAWYLDPERVRRGTAAEPIQTPPEEPQAAESGEEQSEDRAPVLREAVPGQVVSGEDEELMRPGSLPTDKLHEYLTFGGEEDVEWLALRETLEWLTARGFDASPLRRARCGDPEMEEYIRHLEEGQHICDFCGGMMEQGSYEVLRDGRERCPECSKTAVRRLKDVRALYEESHSLLENTFGIRVRSPIQIRVTNAKNIAKELGEEFKPTKGMDPRALGFARSKNGKYSIYLETGAPRDSLRCTIVHELVHIWQYENWDYQEFCNRYGDNRNLVYEGMAVWTEVQLMLCIGQTERAKHYRYNRMQCDDEYGNGLRVYEARYPFQKGARVNPSRTPFGHNPPL